MAHNIIQLQNIDIKELKQIVSSVFKEEISKINNEKSSINDELLSRNEAAFFLGISLPTLRSYVKRGVISEKRLGSKLYYSKKELISSMVDSKKS
ncbi:helix-turn-helix domain-containing protein [Tenacibaculum halocynthiae]|uniref:helix-turn-helix domain-containing protein n=1 Tax=Tenacibaculum halocynthiae TaxID=1254437 RepID=UPI00389388A8